MRYAGIKKFDIENGIGVGLTLFTQGCTKFCSYCHNQSTWDFCGGMRFTADTLEEILTFYKDFPYVKRLTLSGGDPLENLELSEMVVTNFKALYPNHKVWVYTGYTWEYLMSDYKYRFLLDKVDVLVDGKFDIALHQHGLGFKGSLNQRILDVKESLKNNKICLI